MHSTEFRRLWLALEHALYKGESKKVTRLIRALSKAIAVNRVSGDNFMLIMNLANYDLTLRRPKQSRRGAPETIGVRHEVQKLQAYEAIAKEIEVRKKEKRPANITAVIADMAAGLSTISPPQWATSERALWSAWRSYGPKSSTAN